MGSPKSETQFDVALDQILGYLNFSSGNHDSTFFVNLNQVFQQSSSAPTDHDNPSSEPRPTFLAARDRLVERLGKLRESSETFRDTEQCESVISLVFDDLLVAYRDYHRDLLFHQTDEFLFNSFFVGRCFEAVLQQGIPWDQRETIVNMALAKLNDFIGHRPVASLESQKIEPYEHEWVRPVPIYLRDAGAAMGPYQEVIEQAIRILNDTDPHILRIAQFDPNKLDELAIDPRAFDFDHPINKRPNHHFGQWDEHSIDGSGFYRRFIVHQVTLDSLLARVEEDTSTETPRAELMYEASAVLAGTMLMAAGISGCGPGAFDSNTTLSDLLPVIAGYRDQFYADLLRHLPSSHRERLDHEIEIRKQPFGAVRQDLNGRLSQRRACQLVNCRLASIFARMGYPQAAEKQSLIVPVASARIICQIDCLLSSASNSITDGDLDAAFESIPAVMQRLKRGIHCGAIVDPWNILGFDANYSLFPAVENSVRDHRVYELVELMERIFALCSRLWSEAAASDRSKMCAAIRREFLSIVNWWRQFAAHEVMSVDALDAEEIFQAAELVAEALNLWHKGGAATGDISFWAQHAALFDSPKAYALVIDALMHRGDHKTTTALLIHWLSQASEIPLQVADSSFHDLVFRWMNEQKNLLHDYLESENDVANKQNIQTPDEIWNRIRKFYDFLEANADHYWSVPNFQFNPKLDTQVRESNAYEEDYDEFGDEEDSDDDLYRAAYDDVVYHDTADDGVEGELFGGGSLQSDDALEAEVDRVLDRLEFLSTLSSYWATAATIPLPVVNRSDLTDGIRQRLAKRREIISNWIRQAATNRDKLAELLDKIDGYSLPTGGSDHDAMLHYDQHRLYKDTLLDQTIHTCIETENAVRMLMAIARAIDHLLDQTPLSGDSSPSDSSSDAINGNQPLVTVFAAILLKDARQVLDHFDGLTQHLHGQSLLYVPISKGGNPISIVRARVLQIAILDLLRHLPAMGLFVPTYELTNTALSMERNNPIGQGAVTEFDELFEIAFSSMVKSLVRSTRQYKEQQRKLPDVDRKLVTRESETILFDCIEKLTESMLILWLDHSRTLRLSVLEKVNDKNSWERLVEFVGKYGEGLFTQHFLHLANIRAILHQGVDHWLTHALEATNLPDLRLFDELGEGIPRQKAVRYLTLVLEAVIENYNEYRDYNTTTTQSDHGESLYTFLDFLRLRSRYDRVCWNLKPVIWAHRILVNDQENGVARMWRRSLTDRVGPEADKYLNKLESLRNKYSMRMESVGRRLEGRFGHQMQIDRLRALVGPAMDDPNSRASARTFELLQHEAQAFARSTIGVGIDLPAWLAALEQEVEQHHLPGRLREQSLIEPWPDGNPIPIAKLKEQLEQLPNREGMF